MVINRIILHVFYFLKFFYSSVMQKLIVVFFFFRYKINKEYFRFLFPLKFTLKSCFDKILSFIFVVICYFAFCLNFYLSDKKIIYFIYWFTWMHIVYRMNIHHHSNCITFITRSIISIHIHTTFITLFIHCTRIQQNAQFQHNR